MNDLYVLDVESFANYFLVKFRSLKTNKIIDFEIRGADKTLGKTQTQGLKNFMADNRTFGFNSIHYDMLMIMYSLQGQTAEQLCKLSNIIIKSKDSNREIARNYKLSTPKNFRHLDIKDLPPAAKVSLKLYGGRIHSKRLQDLPIEPNSTLTEPQMDEINQYCGNDLQITIDLYNQLLERIDLRLNMTKQYGVNLMSKSDAQIAEQVIKSELGKAAKRPKFNEDLIITYSPPDFIEFTSPVLIDILDYIMNYDFKINKLGSVDLPSKLRNEPIVVGDREYQMGIGGLHSKEKSQTVVPDDDQFLIDKDVASYYPAIILNNELYPLHLGPTFLEVYQKIVTERLQAKKAGNKVINESLKIVINGSFGKFGSQYSTLYAPDLMISVTITGQLALLMLIERLEAIGISVVSANTDGFVSLMGKDQHDEFEAICKQWEQETGFVLEANFYTGLYSRDVNSYIATYDGGCKAKGCYRSHALDKSPESNICSLAVQKLLTDGTPIWDTIIACEDIREFVSVKKVTGGAMYGGEYLGGVVRWIYSTKGDVITYRKNGNKVAKSDGARPLMTLGDFPDDIDYDRYYEEALNILEAIGYNEF